MKTTEEYDGTCKVTELVFVRYKVDFRPDRTFAESLKRFTEDYAGQLARAYNAHNPGASVMPHQITIVSIQNGWR